MKRILLAAGLLLGAVLWWEHSELPSPSIAAATAGAQEQAAAQAAEAVPTNVQSIATLARELKRKTYATWAANKVRDLSHKPIRTREEQEMWNEILSSPESLLRAETRILSPRKHLAPQVDQRERMDAVLILMRALEWKQNPNMDRVIETAGRVIRDTSFENEPSMDIKRSLAGDRIELYVTLKEQFPAEAERIGREATPLQKKFIAWANNFYSLNNKGEI
jgi:hypothetical protein